MYLKDEEKKVKPERTEGRSARALNSLDSNGTASWHARLVKRLVIDLSHNQAVCLISRNTLSALLPLSFH